MNNTVPLPCPDAPASLLRPVLAEIAALLERLAATGESGRIDLASLPLGPGDAAALEEALGTGEVMAELLVAGRSTVRETAYAGVWWVRHFGGDDQIATETIEITRVPEILLSHPADIAAAARRLGDHTGPASAGATDAITEDGPDAGP
ncbi:MAG: hydrogenase expression/formation C-terminal domain-containing protein [Hyphomicrobiales bacterium]